MSYKHLIVYYFSGTGNSKKCAEWIAEKGREYKVDTHLINIDRFEKIIVPELLGKTLIGFCSPTHGFNLPPIMMKFIVRFPKVSNADVFILNTRAGMKLHKLYLPGLSGLGQFFPALVLLKKKFSVVGMQPIDLPSNWILVHPGLRKKVVLSLFKKHQRIVEAFAERLFFGGRKYQAFWSFPLDLLVAPIAFGYYFVGRFFLSKTLIASNKCDACTLCVKNCPVKAIKWVDNRPFWTWKCESCMRCVNICPERAIETAHSFAAFVLYLSSILASYIFSHWILGLENIGINNSSFLAELLWFAFSSIVMILVVFSGYRLMHLMMVYKWFNNIIEYTSLSKFSWWRRYRPRKVLRRKGEVIKI